MWDQMIKSINSNGIINIINEKIINDDGFEPYENNANKIIEGLIKGNLSFEIAEKFISQKSPDDIEYGNYARELEDRSFEMRLDMMLKLHILKASCFNAY